MRMRQRPPVPPALANHAPFQALISERLDGRLTAEQSLSLRTHLRRCPICRAVDRQYRSQRQELRAIASQPHLPPRDLWARTAAALDREMGVGGRGSSLQKLGQRGGAARRGMLAGLGTTLSLGLVALLVASQMTGPTSGPSAAPAVVAAAPTPFEVEPQELAVANFQAGTITISRRNVAEACPAAAVDCQAETDTGTEVRLEAGPPSDLAYDTAGSRLAITAHDARGEAIYVVELGSPGSLPGVEESDLLSGGLLPPGSGAVETDATPSEEAPTEGTAEPDVQSTEPGESERLSPTEPPASVAVEPTEPAASPAELTAQPTGPAASPAELTAQPTGPAASPAELTAQPTGPAASATEPAEETPPAETAVAPETDPLPSEPAEAPGTGEATPQTTPETTAETTAPDASGDASTEPSSAPEPTADPTEERGSGASNTSTASPEAAASPPASASSTGSGTGGPSTGPAAPRRILSGVIAVGAPAAWSPDGSMLAFSAMPADSSRGPDIYVWETGEALARPITRDHHSYFASWGGSRLVVSRVTHPENGPDASASADLRISTLVLDPRSGEEQTVEAGNIWLPAVDPTGEQLVFWKGQLREVRNRVLATGGALYDTAWSDLEATAGGQRLDLPGNAAVEDWQIRWSRDGRAIGIWIAKGAGSGIGTLSVVPVDEDGAFLTQSPLLGSTPARRAFSLGLSRVVWLPAGDSDQEGPIRLRTWGRNGYGDLTIEDIELTRGIPGF